MKKYTKFVQKFYIIGLVVALIAALCVTVCLFRMSLQPMNENELQQHYENLLLLQEDFANIDSMASVKQEMESDRIVVTFEGEDTSMKCYFDEQGTYLYRIISDNRISQNFAKSLVLVICTFMAVWIVMTAIEIVLYIPLGVLNRRKS